jgi:hypothetical protein
LIMAHIFRKSKSRHLYARRHQQGVFFRLQDLPEAAQQPGAARDACCCA